MNHDLVDAWYVGGEILSTGQDRTPLPNAAGERHRVDLAAGLGVHEVIEKHGLAAMIASIEQIASRCFLEL